MSAMQGHPDGSPQAVARREAETHHHRWNSPIHCQRRAADLAERAAAMAHMPDIAASLRQSADAWARRAAELGAAA